LVSLSPSLAQAAATTWESDAAHTNVGFSVKHLMISTVRGSFGDVKATLILDEKKLKDAKVEATIAIASITTGNAKRDGHLLSPDFFDAAKYPTMSFKSSSVKPAGKGKLKVKGLLTIKDVTQPVTLDVSYTKAFKHPMTGGQVRGATATTKIKRSKFGLSWNMALETGGVLVSDEVKIELSMEFSQAAAAAAPKMEAEGEHKKEGKAEHKKEGKAEQ